MQVVSSLFLSSSTDTTTFQTSMDYFGVSRNTIRSEAYQRLAKLGTSHTQYGVDREFNKLLELTPKTGSMKLSKVPITLKEYEVLLALCKCTDSELGNVGQARVLAKRLRLYLLELPSQRFCTQVFSISPKLSPWTIIAEHLTVALINLGMTFDEICDEVLATFEQFNDIFFKADGDGLLLLLELSHYLTLIGLLEGLSLKAKLLVSSTRGFSIFRILDTCIDNFDFLNEVELYSNFIYNEPHDYNILLKRDILLDFSPIHYIKLLSQLMNSMINTILGNSKGVPTLEYLLEYAAKIVEDNSAPTLDLNTQEIEFIRSLLELAIQKTNFLDRGEPFIVYSTYNRLKAGYIAKSHNLQIIGCGTFTDNIPAKTARKVYNGCLEIKEVVLDDDLGLTTIQLGSLLVYKDESIGSFLTRTFTSLVGRSSISYIKRASHSVGLASKILSQDAVVTTIYALSNMLTTGSNYGAGRRRAQTGLSRFDSLSIKENGNNHLKNGGVGGVSREGSINGIVNSNFQTGAGAADTSGISFRSKGGGEWDDQDYQLISQNAIDSIIAITQACNDETVTTLTVTILSQKVIKADIDNCKILLSGLVNCAPYLPVKEFLILLKLLSKLSLDALDGKSENLLELIDARVELSILIKQKPDSPLYYALLKDILQGILNKGDVEVLEHHRSHNEIIEIGDQILLYLRPLAELLPNAHEDEEPLKITDPQIIDLFRNTWFNMAVHGYSMKSSNAQKYHRQLERIAYNSPPLASELSWNKTETSLELNTVLKRGSSNHNVKDHRHIIGDIFEISRTLSYPKLIFLSATVFVESLRVKSGDCSKILYYFSDPSVKISGVDKFIGPICFKIIKDYILYINYGGTNKFSAQNIANQLTTMLTLCCHNLEDLQDAAMQCCDLLINKIPSSLCHHKSLFTLFDLLTVLFDSVVDADENEYEPTCTFVTKTAGIRLLLSDSYSWRTETLNRFSEKAKHWVKLVLVKSNIDVKSLIQSYVSSLDRFQSMERIHFGVSFAISMAGEVGPADKELAGINRFTLQNFNTLAVFTTQLNWRSNFLTELMDKMPLYNEQDIEAACLSIREEAQSLLVDVQSNASSIPQQKIIDFLTKIAGLTLVSEKNNAELVRYLVDIPFKIFDSQILKAAIDIWLAVMKDRGNISILLISEVAKSWETSIELRQGLFSKDNDFKNPEFSKMEYSPSDMTSVTHKANNVSRSFEPHLQIIRLFSSSFEATLYQSDHLLKLFTRFVEVGMKNLRFASLHPFARLVRFELIRFAFNVLNYHIGMAYQTGSRSVKYLSELILDAQLSWFRRRAVYPFGSNVLRFKSDHKLLKDVARLTSVMSTFNSERLESKKILNMFFLDDEISIFDVWLSTLKPRETRGAYISSKISGNHISKAYAIDPILAVNLALRYKVKNLDELLKDLIRKNPLPAIFYPDAVQYFIGIDVGSTSPTHHLLYWEPLSPIDCITLFLPPFGSDPYVLQLTMRSLLHHDVNLTFFYVPQIVQSLRFDAKGYVERFIIETAKVSQLFAHQIIWNMLANSYKDDDANEPDKLKPVLDMIQDEMIKSFSDKDVDFYEKEFAFFNEVTSISGKLKPYIKKTKAEKKVKIDEEMALIDVLPGVYLPSNPDGVVVDINRKSGKPLQSHAKAPFLATFKIRKEVPAYNEKGQLFNMEIEKWQSAIFKVGDDCRQDVLALQLISVFRTIWADAGLDLYVFPYRVTATAPGCGVIDVLPNSVSRDMLGREAVNGLYEYFTSKFGPETSIEFQNARNNLVKSLAAYSIISYLLQFKDRHNGNIMYDDQGHILHIDFGFCFDIVPGGVKFEVAPFKLTREMIAVLGGSDQTQSFRWFEELCVKGYLACRPYMETIVRCVTPMLESGLPCFKDTTVKKLRQRFVPGKTEVEASMYFRSLIKKSMESFYTKGYDEFQRLTNGIPY
ncbi:phosphatidylinositol-4- kinase [Scheffersomyces spartinae]|uniref:1-phosphatidylinositol 4-kinase n=1 Tax=Scheffersomyces spartinae TaxID=45513 RepID=A0A9P7VA88_9ASCO|nr:phosphatidylinositol-4- kinase [Scheffersomyces spartinae]KAG7194202.1 phosphatidylinositol-4- kinase [Scheffersomyces spartinae]